MRLVNDNTKATLPLTASINLESNELLSAKSTLSISKVD